MEMPVQPFLAQPGSVGKFVLCFFGVEYNSSTELSDGEHLVNRRTHNSGKNNRTIGLTKVN